MAATNDMHGMFEPLTDSSNRSSSPFSAPSSSSRYTSDQSSNPTNPPTAEPTEAPMVSSTHRLHHVDALRAVALIAVWFYHFNVPFFRGGFAGVDMFFTISGYVITLTIMTALHQQNFSIVQFYKRRFFRLFPAACATVLMTMKLTYLFIAPGKEKAGSIFKSGLGSLTMSSNLYFYWQNIGYFDNQSFYLTPLLHFWSLSVEEQFYVIWAPLVVFLWLICSKLQRAVNGGTSGEILYVLLIGVLALLGICSFIWAHVKCPADANWAFYLLPARAFEFIVGGLLAIRNVRKRAVHEYNASRNSPSLNSMSYNSINQHPHRSNSNSPPHSSTRSSEYTPGDHQSDDDDGDLDEETIGRKDNQISDIQDLISIGSFLTLLFSFSFLPAGATALQIVPTMLSTLMLLAFPSSLVCNVLSAAPFLIRLGRASYSLYVVHWPTSVLITYILAGMNVLSTITFLLLLPLSYVLGMLLHIYVEVPFRHISSPRSIFAVCLIGALTLGFTWYGVVTNGYDQRFPELGDTGWRPDSSLKGMTFSQVHHDVSHLYERGKDVYVKRVGAVTNGTMSEYVFFGDSFTEHLTFALHNVGIKRGLFFEMHISRKCGFRPTGEQSRWTLDHEDRARSCMGSYLTLWKHVDALPSDNSTAIVIANFWQDDIRLHRVLHDLQKELAIHKKRRFALFKEPPGISAKYGNYYSCADLHVILLRKLLFWRSDPTTGGRQCLPKTLMTKPMDTVAKELRFYGAFWFMFARDVPVFDLFKHLCKQHGDPLDFLYSCRPPAHIPNGTSLVYEVGYKQDLVHLSPVGSDYVSDFVEMELYGNVPP